MPDCEAGASAAGSGSGRSRSGSDRVVFFHGQQARLRSLRHQARLGAHKRLDVQVMGWDATAEIPEGRSRPSICPALAEEAASRAQLARSAAPCAVWHEHV